MRMQRNFYEVLGLQRTATKKEIKEKYYSLARQFHPDRAKDKQLADKLFVQINRAYSTLFNDVKRAKYDASLDAMDQAPARGPGSSLRPSSAPQPTTAQQVRAWFDQASRLQTAGDLIQAVTVCTKVIEAEPNNFPGLLLMGDLLAQTGKTHEASAIYDRAVRINPTNSLLREKITRLNALIERRNTNPGIAKQQAGRPTTPPPGAQRPTVSGQGVAQRQPGTPTPNGAQRPGVAPGAYGAQRPSVTQKPPLTPPPVAQRPPTPPAPKPEPPPKSLFDRLLNRK